MSLAIYAAPFNEEFNNNNNNNNDNDNLLNKKRQTHNHNKTQKMYNKESFNNSSSFDKNKVNSVLEEIHNNTEDSNSGMDNFDPPPKPESSGVQKTVANETMQNMINQNNMNMYKVLGKSPSPNYEYDNDLELNNYRNNYGDNKSIDDYYKKMLPNMNGLMAQKNPVNKQYYNAVAQDNNNMMGGTGGYGNLSSQDVLLQKLNYMINLLEEKQDERTNNVTEEVVLYSFLGIFIIFVIDSFARVGKYVR
jgi:hypothetical protein